MTGRRRRGYGGMLAGASLVFVGLAVLLKTAGIMDLDWSLLWPLLLVTGGAASVRVTQAG